MSSDCGRFSILSDHGGMIILRSLATVLVPGRCYALRFHDPTWLWITIRGHENSECPQCRRRNWQASGEKLVVYRQVSQQRHGQKSDTLMLFCSRNQFQAIKRRLEQKTSRVAKLVIMKEICKLSSSLSCFGEPSYHYSSLNCFRSMAIL